MLTHGRIARLNKAVPLLFLLISPIASAEWTKINDAADVNLQKFIDMKSIRQTGPMNTMRRIWEVNNVPKRAADNALSTKTYVEYDCKDRRMRTLEAINFSEPLAAGVNLTVTSDDTKPGNWSDIVKGSSSEIIFNRVCPHDDSDATTK